MVSERDVGCFMLGKEPGGSLRELGRGLLLPCLVPLFAGVLMRLASQYFSVSAFPTSFLSCFQTY